MGLSANRAYKLQKMFKERISSLFSYAVMSHYTHDLLLKKRNEQLFEHADWSKLPQRVRGYLDGYWEAKSEEILRHYVEWYHFIPAYNGHPDRYLTIPETRKLSTVECDIHHHVDSSKSTYCWKDRPDKQYYYLTPMVSGLKVIQHT